MLFVLIKNGINYFEFPEIVEIKCLTWTDNWLWPHSHDLLDALTINVKYFDIIINYTHQTQQYLHQNANSFEQIPLCVCVCVIKVNFDIHNVDEFEHFNTKSSLKMAGLANFLNQSCRNKSRYDANECSNMFDTCLHIENIVWFECKGKSIPRLMTLWTWFDSNDSLRVNDYLHHFMKCLSKLSQTFVPKNPSSSHEWKQK